MTRAGRPTLADRAARHAALGETTRLAIAEALARSDRSGTELGAEVAVASNLLAHHLAVLERAALIERFSSEGDARRRYVRLTQLGRILVGPQASALPALPALFVCTHNSARSQLAAALWRQHTGLNADSAGTEPAARVHRAAQAAARRRGVQLSGASPRALTDVDLDPTSEQLRITVCDDAHEHVPNSVPWIHWSIPDPLTDPTVARLDRVVDALDERIAVAWGDRPTPQRVTGSAVRRG